VIFWVKEAIGVAILGSCFIGLIAVSELWCRLRHAKPEWTRKLVHVGGGLVCLAIPRLICSPWTVLGMAVSLSLVFAIGGRTRKLKALHGVDRKTKGTEYYPFAVFLLFVLTGQQPWLYVSSILVLAVADGFAALIGTRYGSLKYEVEEEQKSLEGSLAFMVIAFLAIHLPMLLMTDLPRETCVLAALLVAILITGFEAVSLRGTDNIFVPVGVCVILSRMATKTVTEIAYQTFSMVGIWLIISLLVFCTQSFNMGGTIVFFLFTYGAWSLGSEMWALPILVGFLSYMMAWLLVPLPDGSRSLLRVSLVFRALILPLIILVLGNTLAMPKFFYGPFVASVAVVLTISLWNHVMWGRPVCEGKRVLCVLGISVFSWCVTVLLTWSVQRATPIGAPLALGALLPVIALINDRLMGQHPLFDKDHLWGCGRLALTAVSASLIMLLQWANLLPCWIPR